MTQSSDPDRVLPTTRQPSKGRTHRLLRRARRSETTSTLVTVLQDDARPNSRLYEVIDVSLDGKSILSHGRCSTGSQFEAFCQAIPPQSDGVIRIILDGGLEAFPDSFPDPSTLVGCESKDIPFGYPPASSQLYQGFHMVNNFKLAHLPTLRALWSNSRPGWFGTMTVKSHRHWCSHARLTHENGFPEHTLQDVWFTVQRDTAGHVQVDTNRGVICFAPYASIDSHSKDYIPCPSSSWKFLDRCSQFLQSENASIHFTDGNETRLIQLVLLDFLSVNLEMISDGLHPKQASDDHGNFLMYGNGDLISYLFDQQWHYKRVERAIIGIGSAIQCLTNNIIRGGAQLLDSGPLVAALYDLRIECELQKERSLQLQSSLHERNVNMTAEINAKPANSVNQLTLLAAFFLPLSLASALLSMQTRFADLNLLLFDFLGTSVAVAALAIALALMARYGRILVDKAIPQAREWPAHERRIMITTLMIMAFLGLLGSFLVGMLWDVILGLKVLGAAALAVFILLFLCSLYRHRVTVEYFQTVYL